jgi:putative transposase
MARPLRIEFSGALYHVTARGNERKPIVHDDFDREEWVARLEQVVRRFAWRCHAWCLMQNHFHLVVETPKANLARGMRQLNGVYAQRFNSRHRRVGHLFQGRYKAILIDREAHLLEACRYVVLNPARAAVGAEHHERWRWSSYRASAGLEPAPTFLDLTSLLERFARERSLARRRYRAFIRDGLAAPTPWEDLQGDIYLAERSYIRRHGGSSSASREVPRAQREPLVVSLEQLLRRESERTIALAYREQGYRLREIAEALGVHYSTVSRRLAMQERA